MPNIPTDLNESEKQQHKYKSMPIRIVV